MIAVVAVLLPIFTAVATGGRFSVERYLSGLDELYRPPVTAEELSYIAAQYTGAGDDVHARAAQLADAHCGNRIWPYPHPYALHRMRGPPQFRLTKHAQIDAIVQCRRRVCAECRHLAAHRNVSVDAMTLICVADRWVREEGAHPGWEMKEQMIAAVAVRHCVAQYAGVARAQQTVLNWHNQLIHWAHQMPRPPYGLVLEYMDTVPYPESLLDFWELQVRELLAPDGRPADKHTPKRKTESKTHTDGSVTVVSYQA